jgi:hypothetical protein
MQLTQKKKEQLPEDEDPVVVRREDPVKVMGVSGGRHSRWRHW